MLELPVERHSDKELFTRKAQWTQNAITVLQKRYLMRDKSGNVVEEPEDMLRRVAKSIAEADKIYDPQANVSATAKVFYDMMIDRKFMPNSPTLMNAGRYLGQLSACFVLPVEDSMEAIFETLKNTALIHKSGGGTGFSFSRVRPARDVVHSTTGISSGPISFMKVYDAATETVKQGGTRRGANMGILRIDHPDIENFVTCKANLTQLNNFNISVAVTENFIQAVEEGTDYEIRNPRSKQVVARKSAREVFDKIVHQAWCTGEPGIVFIDRINRDNPTPHIGEIESTNPCGEQPLLPYESCNLGSINLAEFITDDKIDYDGLRKTVRNAVHFLDNVIDVNKYPLPEIDEMTRANRKIGLGIMGFADMLFKLGIPYNSELAVQTAEDIMSFIQVEGRKKSADLAKERGTFPNFKGSAFDHPDLPPMRNATVTTIAPTGTISIISGCSGGIEPIFALAFERNVLDGTRMLEVNPYFEESLKHAGIFSEDLMRRIIEHGSAVHVDEIPESIRSVFVTSHDITPEWHVRIQAAFQKYTDNAVSKTVNFPESATEDEVRDVYMLAYKLGCKGVTIYRDGSRQNQVMSVKKAETAKEEPAPTPETHTAVTKRDRPNITSGMTFKVSAGCGNLYITVNEDETGPCELFTHLGKSGGCAQSWSEGISRMISLALRSGVDIEEIIEQLKGIACPTPVWDRGEMIKSCSDAIAKSMRWYAETAKRNGGDENQPHKALSERIERSIKFKPADFSFDNDGEMGTICPDCGARLFYEEGCQKCHSCGFSKCG
ncbi:MAG TPA: vitamin B12-dependent ribonucleotide reductase [candidate division Zixibacteria bacterium]|nr:vitamin B12-dependent ribonucleotide reductase [candidate division Zixibacteria bacterium]